MERKNKSPVWKVFIKDAAHKQTICTLCGKEFKYRYTTTNLRDHLKRYHPDWLPECGMDSKESNIVQCGNDDTGNIYVEFTESIETTVNDDETARKNKSAVWQVFVKDADGKNVTCTLCQRAFKFWNSTTNLRSHLKRNHPNWRTELSQSLAESGEEVDSDDETADLEERPSSASSSGSANFDNLPPDDSYVWRVFVKDESKKKVFCTLCQKHYNFSNNAINLFEHLHRLHPGWEPNSEQRRLGKNDQEEPAEVKLPESIMSSNSVFLIHSERKNRSPVWEVFVKDAAKKRTICMLCSKEFKCWNNTANLLDHLRRIHPSWKPGSGIADYDETDPKRPNIARIGNPAQLVNSVAKPLQLLQTSLSTGLPVAFAKPKQIDKAIGEMICLDFQNLSIIEDSGFRRLLKELVPHYKPPSRNTILKETLPDIYNSVSKQIRQELSKTKYVAVSAELWTNIHLEAFVTLTVHYFASDRYSSSVMQTERINGSDHSSEDLAAVMHKIFTQWKILEKITAIVADDDEAIKAACSMLSITHLPCVAHMVNNIMTEVLTQNDDAQVLLQRCQNLVAHFKLNPSATDVLHDIQGQMNQPLVGLKQVEPTRWNSALHMFIRLMEVKEPLSTTLAALPQGPEPISSADWFNIDDFIAVLKPFELLTSEMSTDSYCNISKIVPLVRGVQSSLQNVNSGTELGVALRKSLLEKLDDRFSIYEKCLIPTVATLLDPRFKRAGVGDEGMIDASRAFVVEQLYELKRASDPSGSSKSKSTRGGKGSSSSDIWNFLDEKVHELSSQKAPANSAEVSVNQYLDLPYLKRHDCPFKFWVSQSALEPELSDIAMKFMCIPATSFPADRLYSKAGIRITERRSRITTKNFDTIIFLNKNLS